MNVHLNFLQFDQNENTEFDLFVKAQIASSNSALHAVNFSKKKKRKIMCCFFAHATFEKKKKFN